MKPMVTRQVAAPPVVGEVDNELRRRTYEEAVRRLAPRTRKSYRQSWQRFVRWSEAQGQPYLPASATHVADYLIARSATLTGGSLAADKTAIAFVHNAASLPNPCTSELVHSTLIRLRKEKVAAGERQKQATPLTDDALAFFELHACEQRTGRGGSTETPAFARRRGHAEVALLRTMRDAGLRGAECAALVWEDLEFRPDGSGRLLIRKSKTDTLGAGAVRYLTKRTAAALQLMKRERQLEGRACERECGPEDSVFRLSISGVYRAVQRATAAVGLEGRYTAHSGRVGLAVQLSRKGASTHAIQAAGGWASVDQVRRYTRYETAGRGAVAQLLDD